MKRMISLLAVALLATTFAAGCGKFERCTEANNPDDCKNKEKFNKDSGDKASCKWVKQPGQTDDKKGKCFEATFAGKEEVCNLKKKEECKDGCKLDGEICRAEEKAKTM